MRSASRRALCLVCWISQLILLEPVVAQLTAQDRFVAESWTIEKGLPVNAVNTLVQTRDGYLWLATFDGLVRFDGVRFTVFRIDNTPGLPSNRIIDLLETRDGSLWIQLEQHHLARYKDGTFEQIETTPGRSQIYVLHEDASGELWLGTDGGALRFENDRFVAPAGDAPRKPVQSILRDRRGSLWIGTQADGLFHMSDGRVESITTHDGLPSNEIRDLIEAPDGAIWIGTRTGVVRLRDGRIEPVPPAAPGLLAQFSHFYAHPRTGRLWAGTGNRGILHYRGGRFASMPANQPVYNRRRMILVDADDHLWYALDKTIYRDGQPVLTLPGTGTITSILQDHEGSIWIGGPGLHRLKRAAFSVYSEAEGLAHANAYPVYEDRKGVLWVGTWGQERGGISRIEGDSITAYAMPALPRSIFEDSRGRLWIGLIDQHIPLCLFEDGKCLPLEISEGGPAPNVRIHAIHEDIRGDLWFGGTDGLYRLRDTTWTHFLQEHGLPSGYIRAFFEGDDGVVWMGTNGGGLVRYLGGGFERLTVADGLSSDLIRSIYRDDEGFLWIGTEGRGLCRIELKDQDDLKSARITVYRTSDGLFDEVIHQILEDDEGRLWMSTNRGIFWVARQELNGFAAGRVTRIRSTSYTERDGLRNREANGGMQPAGLRAADGRLWFPTQDGVVVVDPSRIRRNEVPPQVVIEGALRGDESSPRDVEIHYTALSFMAPEDMQFRYMLEGFNKDWIEAGNRRIAYYTNLPPGSYTFRVIASNNNGVWNERGASLALTVAHRFYETTLFLLLCGVLLLLAGPSVYAMRVRWLKAQRRELSRLVDARTADVLQHEARLKEQNEQLEAQATRLKELDELKSRFFANISHEFRTPLTLIIGPLQDTAAGLHGTLSEAVRSQLGLALRNARRLLNLVNEILDVAKLEAGQVKLRAVRDDLGAFVRSAALHFVSLADRNNVQFRIVTPDEPLIVAFDPGLLEKVCANLLSNAFKFTPDGGIVRLAVVQQESGMGDCAAIIVRDNGSGISSEQLPHIFERFYQVDESNRGLQPGTGIGLALTREIVELHGGTIDVSSDLGFGTTFTVRLPMGSEVVEVLDDRVDLEGLTTDGARG